MRTTAYGNPSDMLAAPTLPCTQLEALNDVIRECPLLAYSSHLHAKLETVMVTTE